MDKAQDCSGASDNVGHCQHELAAAVVQTSDRLRSGCFIKLQRASGKVGTGLYSQEVLAHGICVRRTRHMKMELRSDIERIRYRFGGWVTAG